MPPSISSTHRLCGWIVGGFALVVLAGLSGGCDLLSEPDENTPSRDTLRLDWTFKHNGTAPEHPPVVVGDSLVLMSGYTDLTCLRLRDGSVKWSTLVDGTSPLLTERILVDGERAYATHHDDDEGDTSSIRAWDLMTGDEVWRHTFTEDEDFWIWRGLALGDGFVYGAGAHRIFALDKQSGEMAYEIPVARGRFSMTHYDGRLYAPTSWLERRDDGRTQINHTEIAVYDGATGDSLWAYHTTEGSLGPRPIAKNGVVYVGLTTSNSGEGLNYLAFDAETGTERWFTRDVWAVEHLLVDDRIYLRGGQSRVISLDREHGWIDWLTEADPASHGYGGAHSYLDGHLYYPHYNGLYVLDASTGKVVHTEQQTPTGSYVWESAASSSRILVQSSRALLAYRPYQPNPPQK